MIYLVLFIAIVALCCACASLIIAIKERGKKPSKETVVRIERAPVEHPFTYDSERTTYTLDGNLEVTGSVSALKKGGKA